MDPLEQAKGISEFAFGPGSIVAERYELIRMIGEGGMGSVWLALDQSLDAPCAVKLVNDRKDLTAEIRSRLAREAKVSAQLRSPHVVDVFDYGESGGTVFIAMEWLEGEDLAARINRVGALGPATTYRIIAHVARALMNAHAMGIIHRDLKPENVFLVQRYDEEIAKVLDFGIARYDLYSLRDNATRTDSFLGSPPYVSPEQARCKSVDHRTDLWSLAVVAFQCLTGRPPFRSDSLGDLIGMILYEPLPSPTAINPMLPPAVDEWWRRGASRDREKRFQSAKELADELAKALGLGTFITVPTIVQTHTDPFPPEPETSGVFRMPPNQCPPDMLPDTSPQLFETQAFEMPSKEVENKPETEEIVSNTRDYLAAIRGHNIFGFHKRIFIRNSVIGLVLVLIGLIIFLTLHKQKAASTVPISAETPSRKIEVPSPNREQKPASIPSGISVDSVSIDVPVTNAPDQSAAPVTNTKQIKTRTPTPTEPSNHVGNSRTPRRSGRQSPKRHNSEQESTFRDYGI